MTDDTIMLLANTHGVWAVPGGIRPGVFRHPGENVSVPPSDVFNTR